MKSKAKVQTIRKTFSRETVATIMINADPAIIWALLTNASDYPRWNSTVVSLEGTIAKGESIKLKSSLDPKRVFKLKVKEFVPLRRLAWGDKMGIRNFLLSDASEGQTLLEMREKIGGPLFPLFAAMIPSFDESFIRYLSDLKNEAELITIKK